MSRLFQELGKTSGPPEKKTQKVVSQNGQVRGAHLQRWPEKCNWRGNVACGKKPRLINFRRTDEKSRRAKKKGNGRRAGNLRGINSK